MNDIKYLEDINKFHLYFVESIGSTNTFLKENYNDFSDKSILWTKVQTKGRGRYNRIWESDLDYTFSIIFKNKHHNEIIAPLAIVKALKRYGIDSKIKWPNDIYLDNKKLSGILIEAIYSGSNLEAEIVGIGINKTDKPSVNGIGLLKYNIDYKELISRIIDEYSILINMSFNDYIDEYILYSNTINKKIIYQGHEFIARGITKEGHLVIEKDDEIKTISCDEIILR